jgi:LuxR family maltose regulon positive regulatory protein
VRYRPDVAPRVLLLEGKTTIPSLPRQLVARPRVAERLVGLIGSHHVVAVLATPGAGKTTAVVQTIGEIGTPVAWLTLDDADAAPGRLLLYLQAALCRAVPETTPIAAQALAAGVAHAETAALLAEAMPAGPAVLVVDELERLAAAPEAIRVLASFIRYARRETRIVLVGRRDVPLDIGSRVGLHDIARLDERELAFNPEEVEVALALRGLQDVDPASVVDATGGWVAGVLFEAWGPQGSAEREAGDGDPLAGYLGEQILEGLDPGEREFLVVTSLLRDVDAHSARALGEERAEEMLARLADRYLPVTWTRKGTVMRSHPRFRDHLRNVLARRDPGVLRELLTRHGLALAADGHDEEAAVELLAVDQAAEALEPAARALPAIIARQDLAVADSWLRRFAAAGLADEPGLLRARLSLAITLEEFGRAVDAADRLRAVGHPQGGDERALAAWAYWHVGRLDDARAMLADAPRAGVGQVVGFLFSLVDPEPPRILPQPSGGPLDALLLRIMYARGQLAEVRDAPVSAWMPAKERISAYRALGELDRTRELLTAPEGVVHNLRSEATVRAELMIDLGHEDEARQALVTGRAKLVSSESFVFDVISQLLAAKLELRMRADGERALAILRGAEAAGPTRRYGHLAEQLDTWAGYALLLSGEDEAGLTRLETAVGSMLAAGRILELPTAAVCLAEARWRAGLADAAHDAADVALEAAQRQGSMYLLIQALRDLPGVAARRLDAETSVDGAWHEIMRSLAFQRPRQQGPHRLQVRLHDFGTGRLVVDGIEQRARIAKTYALLAYLAASPELVTRDELLDALFDARADASARAYLRQAIHGLRQLLPDGLDVIVDRRGLLLSDPGAVDSDSLLLEARLDSAACLRGTRRYEAVAQALKATEAGPFLSTVDCAWVHQRRAELAVLITEARIGMAVSAFEDSRGDLAEPILKRVLAEDPYRERAWRLLMRMAVARGADDDVIALYRGCEQALRDVGLEPSEPTRLLVGGLRR